MSVYVFMAAAVSEQNSFLRLHFLTRPAAMLALATLNYGFELSGGRFDPLDFLSAALAISIYGITDLFLDDRARRLVKE